MGNYYGTVRCSVCYERGHNKRSCPKHTERLQRQLERYQSFQASCDPIDRQNYDARINRIANQIGKRTGTNPLSGETVTKRGPTRMCSYCKHKHGADGHRGTDHNRRTCVELKTDKQEAIKVNATYRAGVLEGLRNGGVGVGSLIAQTISGYFRDPDKGEEVWSRRKVPTMVRTILWDEVCYLSDSATVLQIQRMDKMGTNEGYEGLDAPLRHDVEGSLLRFNRNGEWETTNGRVYGRWHLIQEESHKAETTLLSPVAAETVNPPRGWEDGESQTIIDHFNRLKG